jgi:pimeloyl-ACP methyl ester carboxylesterase
VGLRFVAAVLAAAALSGVIGSAAPASAARSRTTGFVTVDGHRMFYECSGTGTPTVVLDAGSPDTSTTWRWVQPQIARNTRVCAYDRAGLGRSAPHRRGHRTPRTQVRDLRLMLAAARIPGPYVVVGHSWGGLLARLFAYVYPAQTSGVVLVDATTFPYLTPARARQLRHRRNREGIGIADAVAQSDAIKSLGNLPLVVLGSNKPRLNAKFLAAQYAEAALSTDSVNAIARLSTHYIQRPAPVGQPRVVVTAVGAVVAAARTHNTLPSCPQLFDGLAVTCRS